MPECPGDIVEVHQVGPHRVEIELPDIVHIHYVGNIEPAHFQAFQDLLATIRPPTRIYILRDARNGGDHTRDARVKGRKVADTSRLAAILTYGSSFHGRTILSLFTRAIRMVHPSTPEVLFFDTEAQARAWIDKHRNQSFPTNTP
jgi:hypothetical protein